VHYESFARLASFFGRDMQAHWHDRFFQLHFLDTGRIDLQLDTDRYSVQAPLFILTPPSVPHAFNTDLDSDGHVLTLNQELIWPLLANLYPGQQDAVQFPALCQSIADNQQELSMIRAYWQLIRHEYQQQRPGREQTLIRLSQALLITLLRNGLDMERPASGVHGELRLFQRFNQLVDQHYHQHWSVPEYARQIGLTESRLTDLCRRFSNNSPKRLIFDRLLREAKRQLLFSSYSILEIAYQLGFKDPAYFSRFFNRIEGCSPSEFRLRRWREKTL
ncbi:MAG: 4-hydroxyphenylacetate catabolism regulatory protein HpaA, partial [Enterobacteriaceae bacterium]